MSSSSETTLQRSSSEGLLDALTERQRQAVTHSDGPLLIVAGAGTGKTTVITRRIAWLLAEADARPEQILALTFSEKAAREMQDRLDLILPYGIVDVTIRTFHAFGDQLIREHSSSLGVSAQARLLSQAEQQVFLRNHVFDLPLAHYRPPTDPTRFLDALATLIARAKDELVTPEAMLAWADAATQTTQDEEAPSRERMREAALAYGAYEQLMRRADALDFGDQVALAVRLLESNAEIRAAIRKRYPYVLIDEFQDTNYAQFRLLQLLAEPGAHVTVVADDDQSIYKWRGAAISNVVKFLEYYNSARTVVLTENFRSTQEILDRSYRLIRFNDPDRLEVKQGIDKRLTSTRPPLPDKEESVAFHLFDTASSEADWVARAIREAIAKEQCRARDIAILVRSNREADLFLRAMNVQGVPWKFSGTSGLFSRPECKMLVSCLRMLADPDDSMSWFHVASSRLYGVPMADLMAVTSQARQLHRSFRAVLEMPLPASVADEPIPEALQLSEKGRSLLEALRLDRLRLLESSRQRSAGQVLYQWLQERGLLTELAHAETTDDAAWLESLGQFFDQLRKVEDLVGGSLPEIVQHLELFEAMGNEPVEVDDIWADRVNVLTIHKAKGLEFGMVFMVGLIQGRFPSNRRSDPIELPEALISDILPSGDYHLQEERRLFYVGMTRAKERLHLTAALHYGGKSIRKPSRFVLEALDLPAANLKPRQPSAVEKIERSAPQRPLPATSPKPTSGAAAPLRLDAHGADDYLTCPLKYKYSHVLRVPVMRHHLVIYGTAVHRAVEEYFRRKLAGAAMTEAEILTMLEREWRHEGFLSREHEEQRLEQARSLLRQFFARQQERPEDPGRIEEKFKFRLSPDVLVSGRFDRVDGEGAEAVIIDYKTSDVREQAQADRRARESFQLQLYALAWQNLFGTLPKRVELRFLESNLVGAAYPEAEDLVKTYEQLAEAAAGIRAGDFHAKPSEVACQRCAFQPICPFAYRPR